MSTKINKNAKHLLQIIGIITFFVCSYNLYQANVVTISSDMPETIVPGMTVPITVTIEKGNIEGFGRYTSTLPKGFSATSTDPNFTFSENTITVLWVKLPKSDSFSFTYNIIAPEKTKNSFVFSAKFGYVENNEKRFAEMTPLTVNISNNAKQLQIAQETQKQSNDVRTNEITCYRTIGYYNNEATVSVRINQANSQSMCKIEEMLPEGYTLTSIDNAGAELSNVQNVARYMWAEAPKTQEFSIVYKVSANKGYNINDLVINGAFSIYDDNMTKSFIILDNNMSVDESTGTITDASDQLQLATEKNAAGKYDSNAVRQDIASHKYNSNQTSFFANTDAVNTIDKQNKSDITTEIANIEKLVSNEKDSKETVANSTPSQNDVNKFENDVNIPAPTAAKVEKEKEYEIVQTTEKSTKSEIVSEKPELINNILAHNTSKPTITNITDEQEVTQTKTETITQVTKTTTTIKPIQANKNNIGVVKVQPQTQQQTQTQVAQAPMQTKQRFSPMSSTQTVKPALINKNNDSQRETKVRKSSAITYRVQIAASHKKIRNQQAYFARRNIKDNVKREKINSWYKYTVKSFDTYLKARNQRNSIWQQTPIKGAFVVAYNGTKRITVQEGLMLSHQKWVK